MTNQNTYTFPAYQQTVLFLVNSTNQTTFAYPFLPFHSSYFQSANVNFALIPHQIVMITNVINHQQEIKFGATQPPLSGLPF
jgi:hypothetical protein